MVTIGIDPHKQTHTAAAVDRVAVEIGYRTTPARRAGFGQLLEWARALDSERVWVIEDVRNVSGSLERFLLDRGETVVRLAPRLMADARRGMRTRGKSDPIDALAIARAALREGVDTLPTVRLAGPELEIRQLALHRARLVDTRTRLINELRWQLHDLWPEWEIPIKALIHPGWQTKVTGRLARAPRSTQVWIARDMIRRIRELTPRRHRPLRAARRPGPPSRPPASGRTRDRRPSRREVHRRDRQHRALHLRRATRPPRTICLT